MSLITSAIILAMQSNLVISLGMVGALSIVRFRTAIKDPMDLAFLFWSISIGIICGAGLYEIALVTSVGVTVFILVLDMLPVGKMCIRDREVGAASEKCEKRPDSGLYRLWTGIFRKQ